VTRSKIQNFTHVNTYDCCQSRDYKKKLKHCFVSQPEFNLFCGTISILTVTVFCLLKYDKSLHFSAKLFDVTDRSETTVTGHYPWVFYHTTGGRAVCVVTRLRNAQSGVRIHAGARHLSRLQNVQTSSGAHPASYSMGTGVLSGE
jgi:hypothetical protein